MSSSTIPALDTVTFVFGLLAMMAFYHFILFLERPEDKGSGWFGALCALFAMRTLLTGRLLETYFDAYASVGLHEWLVRSEYWTFCLAPASFVLFYRTNCCPAMV